MSRVALIAGQCISALALTAAAVATHARDRLSDEPRERVPLDELRNFDAVSLSGSDHMVVRNANEFSIRVEGDPLAIERLDIYVDRRVLHVERRWKRGREESPDRGATVYVTLPVLAGASLHGSGDLSIDRLKGDRIELAVAGSGDLHIDVVEARVASLSVAGSGTLAVRGKVREASISIAGSGNVRAENLVAEWTKVSIAGSGDAHAHATGGANVSIVGSGDVSISGTRNCRLSRIGSGDLHCSA